MLDRGMDSRFIFLAAVALWTAVPSRAIAAQTYSVATYNLENYLDVASGTRRAKLPEAKEKIRECIRTLNPDVNTLAEIGTTNALFELRDSLKAEGSDYPYWEHVGAFDTNIFLAVL